MKKNWTHIAMGAMATILITASIAVALDKTVDDDLINLLDKVEQVNDGAQEGTQPAATPSVSDDSLMDLLNQADTQTKSQQGPVLPTEQDNLLIKPSDDSITDLLKSMGVVDETEVEALVLAREPVAEEVTVEEPVVETDVMTVVANVEPVAEESVVIEEMAVEEPVVETEAMIVEEARVVESEPEIVIADVEPIAEEPVVIEEMIIDEPMVGTEAVVVEETPIVESEPEIVVADVEPVIEEPVIEPDMEAAAVEVVVEEAPAAEIEAVELTAIVTDAPDAESELEVVENLETMVTEAEVAESDSDDPLLRVLESMKAVEEAEAAVEAEEEAFEAEVADIESDEPEIEEVDDIGMATYDDATASKADNLISVRLNKVGLEEAINLFAQLSGANIIVPELSEAAQISVNLKDVEWRPALQSILDAYNYELYQRVSGSNVYSVRRRPEGAPEPQVVETFKLDYATVPNAAELVRQLLPADAKISEFASRNMLVVKSTESSLSEVRSVLDSIDTVRQQVFIESKFMELTDKAQKDLGIDWQVLQSYSFGTAGKPTLRSTRTSTRDQFSDDSGNSFQDASSSFREYEAPNAFFDTVVGGGPVVANLTPTRSESTSRVLTSVLDMDEFRMVLGALQSKNGVNIVSNPKIIVANEETANISIIEREPNLKQTLNEALNDTASSVIFELDPKREFFDFGIMVDVTPSINTSSNITVQIKPSLTRKVGVKDAGQNSYPIISEKSIETIFNLTSGQTAAIGGLAEVEERDIERKVPLLGNIPFLGRLFSWEQTVNGHSETIIFVTVGLANTQLIDSEAGMPEDTQLARRRIITERNKREMRKQRRLHLEAAEKDKLEDTIRAMNEQEALRVERRKKAIQMKLEREAKKVEREASRRNKNEVATTK